MSRRCVVDDNAHVHAGDVIAKIDDGDYRLAVDSARGKVTTQQATIERIGKQIEAQQAAIDQAKAQLASAEAGATRAELELARQQALAARDYASKQALEAAQASKAQTAASVQGAQAAVEAAEANTQVLQAQQEEAARTLKELNTALAKAERDLSFTVIKAPMDGVVGNRAMQVGDYVQPGQRLASLVPLDAVYVDANFKETQLGKLQPGQPVKIAVDSLGGAEDRRHGGERRAGLRLGVLAAAAGQRDRQLHQDRAARAGAHRGAVRPGREGRAAPRHVGRRQRRHQAGRGRERAGAHRGESGRDSHGCSRSPQAQCPGKTPPTRTGSIRAG